MDEDNAANDSDYTGSSKKAKKRGSTKHSTSSSSAQIQESPGGSGSDGMPTIAQVCSTFGLTDVELTFTDTDYQNLTTYKLFQQHVRPLLAKENPKVPMSKLMMLVAAKWREFSVANPHLQSEEQQLSEPEYSKPTRTRVVKEKVCFIRLKLCKIISYFCLCSKIQKRLMTKMKRKMMMKEKVRKNEVREQKNQRKPKCPP